MDESLISLFSSKFPRLTEMIEGAELEARQSELEKLGLVPLWQVEQDLELLARYRPWEEMAKAYRNLLRNVGQFIPAMYEIRAAAMLAPFVDKFELSPRVGAGRCDLRAEIARSEVFVEVSAEEEKFPPHYDGQVYERVTVGQAAGSNQLRQRISDELGQLPPGEMTVVVLGARGGRSLDMECALLGDERYRLAGQGGAGSERLDNGLFTVSDELGGVSRLSAVVWIKLVPHFHDIRVYSRLFTNPRAAVPLSRPAGDLFRRIFDSREMLLDELARIKGILVEKYSPDRIILFGSLAEEVANGGDRVHQDSDIDLAVVKSTPLRFVERALDVMELVEPRVGLHVLVYTPKEIEQAEREGNFFVRDEILTKGRVIFP